MTATPELEQLGRTWGWKLESRDHLSQVQALLERGGPIGVFQDAGRSDWWESFFGSWPHHLERLAAFPADNRHEGMLVISDRIHPPTPAPQVVFRPPTLAIGLFLEGEPDADEFAGELEQWFQTHRLSSAALLAVATIRRGTISAAASAFAEEREVPLLAYLESKLSIVQPRARHPVGTQAGVAEAAALLASGASQLLVEPARLGGITVAVARRLGA